MRDGNNEKTERPVDPVFETRPDELYQRSNEVIKPEEGGTAESGSTAGETFADGGFTEGGYGDGGYGDGGYGDGGFSEDGFNDVFTVRQTPPTATAAKVGRLPTKPYSPGHFPQRAGEQRVPAKMPERYSGARGKRDLLRLQEEPKRRRPSPNERRKTTMIWGISGLVALLLILAGFLYYRNTVLKPQEEAERSIVKLYTDASKKEISPDLNETDLAAAEALVQALPESEYRSDAREELQILRHCLYLKQVRDAYAAEERSYSELPADQLNEALTRAEKQATPLDDVLVQDLTKLREEYNTFETISGEVALYMQDPILFYNSTDQAVEKSASQIATLGRAVDRDKLQADFNLLKEYRDTYQKILSYSEADYDLREVQVEALQTEVDALGRKEPRLFMPLASAWAKLEVEVAGVAEIEQTLILAFTDTGELKEEFTEEAYKQLASAIEGLPAGVTKDSYRLRLATVRSALDARQASIEAAKEAERLRRKEEILSKQFTTREAADLLYWHVHKRYPENTTVDLAYYEPSFNAENKRWELKLSRTIPIT